MFIVCGVFIGGVFVPIPERREGSGGGMPPLNRAIFLKWSPKFEIFQKKNFFYFFSEIFFLFFFVKHLVIRKNSCIFAKFLKNS